MPSGVFPTPNNNFIIDDPNAAVQLAGASTFQIISFPAIPTSFNITFNGVATGTNQQNTIAWPAGVPSNPGQDINAIQQRAQRAELIVPAA